MKFRLVENFLFESIEDMMKYYPNISKTDFMKYIALDPTYKEGSNSAGKYAKWILNLVKNNKMTNQGHIKDLLTRFEDNKKMLKNKDIMSYKTIEDVENALNDDSSYSDLSHRQEVRKRQNDRKNVDLNKDAEKVYEDEDWEVWVPHTYAASCKLGQGTTWCTASTETDEYYRSYKANYGGEYYININKHDRDDKYQFHFESKQFMNKDDESCEATFFVNKSTEGLYKFYSKMYDLTKYGIFSPEETEFILKNGVVVKDKNTQVPKFVTKVVLDDNVPDLRDGCFELCESLKSIDLKNVIKLGDKCFFACTSLQSIDLKNVNEIGDWCFAGCGSLQSIDLKNVTQLGDSCFWYCDSLQAVDLRNVTELGEMCFKNCNSLQSIDLKNVAYIGGHCFDGCRSLQSIDLKNVTQLAERCFYRCKSLESIDLKNVTEIGWGCFDYCTSLKEIICHNENQLKQCQELGYGKIAVLR